MSAWLLREWIMIQVHLVHQGRLIHTNMLFEVQLIFGGWGRYDLPKESSEIEPFIAGIKSHRPIPDWVHKTIRSLIDHGLPSFEAAKIRTLSFC